jgi:hypothetical protein
MVNVFKWKKIHAIGVSIEIAIEVQIINAVVRTILPSIFMLYSAINYFFKLRKRSTHINAARPLLFHRSQNAAAAFNPHYFNFIFFR